MQLQLRGDLCWHGPAGAQRLPMTLAGALLLVLAREGRWLTRSELAGLFWPDVPEARALQNLRVQLLRARQVAAALAGAPPLDAERRRLRWAVPLEPDAAARGSPADGLDVPGFPAFGAWLQAWREHDAGDADGVGTAGFPDEPMACGAGRRKTSGPARTAVAAPAPGAADHGTDRSADDRAIDSANESADGDFVGRRVEQARLRAIAAPVRLVTGEPGIGKTRLVAESFAADEPWLRCQQGLQAVPFAPVATLLHAHPGWLADLGAYRLDVARLLPGLLAPGEPLPPLDALTARARLFEGLAQCVERHVHHLRVDDLQWADSASADWLLLLARRGRLRWTATVRDAELPAALAQALDALVAEGRAGTVALAGLDRDALASLRRRLRPDLAPDDGWGRALHDGTGGNPFYAAELLAALPPGERAAALPSQPLPERVAAQLRRRLQHLPPAGRALAEAAALAIGRPAPAQLAAMAGLPVDAALPALEQAGADGLLSGTLCRHDLVRAALQAGVSDARAAALHARAARHLAAEDAAPALVAHHWLAAGRADEAAPWQLRAALALRLHGDRDAAHALLDGLRTHGTDPALALHADILLAQEHLLDDLAAGRRALEAALARTAGVAQVAVRRRLQAQALAGLLDNAVFAGDTARSAALARGLRARLAGLPPALLAECHQVLIEQAMRVPDAAAAHASLQALRASGVAEPVWLSFEAQIHWFLGAVRDARDAFERLLARHPDHCRGLTIENDLAVMCQTLGELDRAEVMARRSLASWAGVPHTQALSLLVLGATLTSRGDFAAAHGALHEAERLGQAQGSALFVAEARVRRARAHWCAGDTASARAAAAGAHAAIDGTPQPLLDSALALIDVLTATDRAADGRADDAIDCAGALARLDAAARRCPHPLVQVRRERARAARADAVGDRVATLTAARAMHATAERASLAEWACEALWLLAADDGPAAAATADRAAALAQARGFGWLRQPPPGTAAAGEKPAPRA
jgi:hypothetical protein